MTALLNGLLLASGGTSLIAVLKTLFDIRSRGRRRNDVSPTIELSIRDRAGRSFIIEGPARDEAALGKAVLDVAAQTTPDASA